MSTIDSLIDEFRANTRQLVTGLEEVKRLLREFVGPARLPGELFSVKQAAAQMGVCERTIRDLVRSGKLTASRIGKGRGTLRFDPAQLQHYQLESAGHFRPKRGRWPSS